jgi:hypothetical protein
VRVRRKGGGYGLDRAIRERSKATDHSFDPAVRDEPQQGHRQVDRACDPRIDKREQNTGDIEQQRNLALGVTTDCLGERRVDTNAIMLIMMAITLSVNASNRSCSTVSPSSSRGTVARVLLGELHVLDEDIRPVPTALLLREWKRRNA